MNLSSLFRAAASPPLLPQYEHELRTLSRSQYPPKPTAFPNMAASTVTSHMDDRLPLMVLERKEKQLQRQLQTLLDAQGEGLMAGLSQGTAGDAWSDGSNTPVMSASNIRASKTIPVRQPARRKVGLRAARRGILQAMQELVVVKHDEALAVEADMHEHEGVIRQVDGWAKRREGLEREIRDIQGAEEGVRVSELKGEEQALRTEIHELETRLYELKAKHQHLSSELSQVENSVQAKLSSYRASSSILETQIRKFLDDPPAGKKPTGTANDAPFLSLPPKRRTLELARDHWEGVHEHRAQEHRLIEMEGDALEEGALIWEDVFNEVTTFERSLRREMRRLGSMSAGSNLDTPANGASITSDESAGGLDSIISDMNKAIGHLESKFELAEKRDWKLLICCIGAELEAFKQGRELLQGALGSSASGAKSPAGYEVDERPTSSKLRGSRQIPTDGASDHGLGELREDSGTFHDAIERSEGEDEDPDPRLMVSHD